MESILPSEAKGNMSREDFGELLQPVFDQLMDLHNTILPDGRSKLSANFGLTLCLNNADTHIADNILLFLQNNGPARRGNTNLQFSQSQKETTRLYEKSSDIYEHLLAFCETQLGQFRKFSSETQSEQEKEKYTKVISLYEELREKVEAEDPEGYNYDE
jgi:hypothetical protein